MNDRATLIKPSTIRFERLLPGPVERVWAYLTESKKRATWLAAGEFDLRVGGKIELHFDNESLTDEAAPGALWARASTPPRAKSRASSRCDCWRTPGAGTAGNRK